MLGQCSQLGIGCLEAVRVILLRLLVYLVGMCCQHSVCYGGTRLLCGVWFLRAAQGEQEMCWLCGGCFVFEVAHTAAAIVQCDSLRVNLGVPCWVL